MQTLEKAADVSSRIADEDVLRAHLYRLLAGFLGRVPGIQELKLAAAMSGDDTDLGKAIQSFSKIAAGSDPARIEDEYNNLFIGVGRGELLPYASYYLTGFLHGKPLAKLRADMERRGIGHSGQGNDPEDHIAALMDMMAGLILGEFTAPADIASQKEFFAAHLAPWAKHFFQDLQKAKSSVLYAALGSIGVAFMTIEETAFEMD
jgi:TorA maturation chaperone TorD